jgi:hypothetical protein
MLCMNMRKILVDNIAIACLYLTDERFFAKYSAYKRIATNHKQFSFHLYPLILRFIEKVRSIEVSRKSKCIYVSTLPDSIVSIICILNTSDQQFLLTLDVSFQPIGEKLISIVELTWERSHIYYESALPCIPSVCLFNKDWVSS